MESQTYLTSVLVIVDALHVLVFYVSVKTEVLITDILDIRRCISPYSSLVRPRMPSTTNDLIEDFIVLCLDLQVPIPSPK